MGPYSRLISWRPSVIEVDAEIFHETINESDVPTFRARALTPVAILRLLVKSLGSLFLRLPLGLGKSSAVDRLMAYSDTLKKYDLIVYCSPSRIINSDRIKYLKQTKPTSFTELKPRPRRRCGPLNDKWLKLESQNCGSAARNSLCSVCPERKKRSPCTWPISLGKKIKNKQILVFAEQYFIIDPSFLLRLQFLTSAKKILLIFDEGRLASYNFEVKVTQNEIALFKEALRIAKDEASSLHDTYDIWDQSLDILAKVSSEELNQKGWDFPPELNFHSEHIQDSGLRLAGDKFKYLGYVFSAFPYSKGAERWKDPFGTISFIARPYFKVDTLVLAAHLPQKYVADRLGLPNIESPFEKLRVRHSQTQIYNLRNSIGSERNFYRNHKQILDFFAAMIIENIKAGKTTLLVSRKKFKPLCKRYLEQQLIEAGYKIKISDKASVQKTLNPSPVALINYGVLGLNHYEKYDSCFCLNSYNISEKTLEAAVQSRESLEFRVPIYIQDKGGVRRVTVDREHQFAGLVEKGEYYLKVLETDPVLQAIGRVRFCTNPRTIITFQKQDLTDELGDVCELNNLAEAYKVLKVTRLKIADRERVCKAYVVMKGQGISLRAAARQLNMDKSTLSRWFRAYQEVSQISCKNINRENETPFNLLNKESPHDI